MFKTKKSRPAAAAPPATTGVYVSSEVARISGVSLRQLQWWDEQNVVSPRHDGHKRVYLPNEVIEVTVIAELRRKGFSLQKIRRVLRYLQREMDKRLSEAISSDAEVHLLTDGKSIYLEESKDRIIDLLKNAKQPMFLVCVSDQARRLDGPLAKKQARSETAWRDAAGQRSAVGYEGQQAEHRLIARPTSRKRDRKRNSQPRMHLPGGRNVCTGKASWQRAIVVSDVAFRWSLSSPDRTARKGVKRPPDSELDGEGPSFPLVASLQLHRVPTLSLPSKRRTRIDQLKNLVE